VGVGDLGRHPCLVAVDVPPRVDQHDPAGGGELVAASMVPFQLFGR
jgi:hypothetical protein